MAPFHRLVELLPFGKFDPSYAPARSALLAGLVGGGTVLDVGCGPGPHASLFLQQYASRRVVGIDASPGMVSGAQLAVPDALFAVGDGRDLPFRAEQFDVVHCSMLLHHVPPYDRAKVISEMARVAKRAVVIEDLTGMDGAPLSWLHRMFCTIADGSYVRFTVGQWEDLLSHWNVRERVIARGSIRARLAMFVLEPWRDSAGLRRAHRG